MRRHKFTEEEKAFVRAHFKVMKLREMAEELGVTTSSISSLVQREGLKKYAHHQRTPELEAKICEMMHRMTTPAIARELGVSETLIKNTATRYGVVRTPEEMKILGAWRHLPRKKKEPVVKTAKWGLSDTEKETISEMYAFNRVKDIASTLGLTCAQVKGWAKRNHLRHSDELTAAIKKECVRDMTAANKQRLINSAIRKASEIKPWRDDDKARAKELELQIDDLDVQLDSAKTADEMLAIQRRMSVLVAQLNNLNRKPEYRYNQYTKK